MCERVNFLMIRIQNESSETSKWQWKWKGGYLIDMEDIKKTMHRRQVCEY